MIGRQTGREMDRQTEDRETGRVIERQAECQMDWNRQTEGQRVA